MTHPLIDILTSSIAAHCLLTDRTRPVIAALSGGADSVALLSALVETGYTCIAAHCNYHLRGEESNRDMRLCRDLCDRLGVDLYVHDFDVNGRRAVTGESVEMACRALRYEWFDALLERLRAQAIAVAHHREDNEETFLINLLRGSSLSGLTGMRPRNGYVVRPLLEASREQIEDYLNSCGLDYVTDSSNLGNDYLRNRLRHIVLPAMRRAVADADRGLLASMSYLGQNRAFYEQQMGIISDKYRHGDKIDLASLAEAEPHARLILFEMLKPMGFNMTHVDNILASSGASGLSFNSSGYCLQLSRGTLDIIPLSHKKETPSAVAADLRRDILSPLHIVVTEHDISQFRPERDPKTAYFDISILDDAPKIEIRPPHRGDRIMPFGMHATRLVSDILREARLSAREKSQIRLLTHNDVILWVIGIRASGHFAITPSTKRYLRLRLR